MILSYSAGGPRLPKRIAGEAYTRLIARKRTHSVPHNPAGKRFGDSSSEILSNEDKKLPPCCLF
ncbi:MAG: hypothetical protein QOK24_878 [Verrucomicrobiota bacterium]|jgi:hypothetical protein